MFKLLRTHPSFICRLRLMWAWVGNLYEACHASVRFEANEIFLRHSSVLLINTCI